MAEQAERPPRRLAHIWPPLSGHFCLRPTLAVTQPRPDRLRHLDCVTGSVTPRPPPGRLSTAVTKTVGYRIVSVGNSRERRRNTGPGEVARSGVFGTVGYSARAAR